MYPIKFDHLHYKTQSFDATKQFYIEVMGAIDRGYVDLGKEGQRSPNLQLELAGITLFFAEDSSASTNNSTDCDSPCNVPPWNTRHGVYHMAVLVDDCDDATEYFSKKAKEVYNDPDLNIVALGPFMAGDKIRASFLNAPDGMAIELKQDI